MNLSSVSLRRVSFKAQLSNETSRCLMRNFAIDCFSDDTSLVHGDSSPRLQNGIWFGIHIER